MIPCFFRCRISLITDPENELYSVTWDDLHMHLFMFDFLLRAFIYIDFIIFYNQLYLHMLSMKNNMSFVRLRTLVIMIHMQLFIFILLHTFKWSI